MRMNPEGVRRKKSLEAGRSRDRGAGTQDADRVANSSLRREVKRKQ